MEEKTIKDVIRNLRDEAGLLSTSDLQGVVSVRTKELEKLFNISKKNREDIEGFLLEYANSELDINSTQRYILDFVNTV